MFTFFLYVFLMTSGSAYLEASENQETTEPSKERKRDRLKRYAKKIYDTVASDDSNDVILFLNNDGQILFDENARELFAANTYKRDDSIQSIAFTIVPTVEEIEMLGKIAPKVQEIDMSNIFRGNYSSVASLLGVLSTFKNLTSLKLNNNGLQQGLLSLKNLQGIPYTPPGLDQKHFKKLETLELSNNAITYQVFSGIISYLTKLKRLDISKNGYKSEFRHYFGGENQSGFNDYDLDKLYKVLKNLIELEELNIAECFYIELSKSLKLLKENLPKLKRLDISSSDFAFSAWDTEQRVPTSSPMGAANKKSIMKDTQDFLFVDGQAAWRILQENTLPSS